MKPRSRRWPRQDCELRRKRTRRDAFLAQMDQVVPWAKLCALIEPAVIGRRIGLTNGE